MKTNLTFNHTRDLPDATKPENALADNVFPTGVPDIYSLRKKHDSNCLVFAVNP